MICPHWCLYGTVHKYYTLKNALIKSFNKEPQGSVAPRIFHHKKVQ